jgi:excisionase family DNA binding protein
MRVGEAAELLDVSEGLLRRLIAEGKIPSYKLSEKTTRIDLDELRNFMRVIVVEGNPIVDGKSDKPSNEAIRQEIIRGGRQNSGN